MTPSQALYAAAAEVNEPAGHVAEAGVMPVMVTLANVIAEAFGFVTVTATWVTVPAVTAESETGR